MIRNTSEKKKHDHSSKDRQACYHLRRENYIYCRSGTEAKAGKKRAEKMSKGPHLTYHKFQRCGSKCCQSFLNCSFDLTPFIRYNIHISQSPESGGFV